MTNLSLLQAIMANEECELKNPHILSTACEVGKVANPVLRSTLPPGKF